MRKFCAVTFDWVSQNVFEVARELAADWWNQSTLTAYYFPLFSFCIDWCFCANMQEINVIDNSWLAQHKISDMSLEMKT